MQHEVLCQVFSLESFTQTFSGDNSVLVGLGSGTRAGDRQVRCRARTLSPPESSITCKSLSCYLVYLQFKNCLSCVRLERASYTLQAVRRRAVNPRQRWREHNFARVQLHQLLLLLLRLQLLLVVVKVKRSCRLRGGERAAAVVLRRHGRV